MKNELGDSPIKYDYVIKGQFILYVNVRKKNKKNKIVVSCIASEREEEYGEMRMCVVPYRATHVVGFVINAKNMSTCTMNSLVKIAVQDGGLMKINYLATSWNCNTCDGTHLMRLFQQRFLVLV